MANRNSVTQAIILKTQIQGEHNRNVCLLSETEGIVHATLYGGAKSKLSALVQPLSSGKLWLYTDSTRNMTKISDFDAQKSRLNIRESLYRLYASNLACEIVMKTKAAGEAKTVFYLLNGFLDGLDAIADKEAHSALVRFLWRYLAVMGIQPPTDKCMSCHTNLQNIKEDVAYVSSFDGFLCSNCANEMQNAFHISPEAHSYLSAMASSLSPRAVRAMSLSPLSLSQLRTLLFYLSEEAVGMKLKSIETSVGIL